MASKKVKTIHQPFIHLRNSKRPLVGAHVSSAKGVFNSIPNGAELGCNAIAMFLKNQRTWKMPVLSEDEVEKFKSNCVKFEFSKDHFVPHGSYLINLGNPDEEKRNKSLQSFIDDLKRCDRLGIGLYNFHPGSTVGQCTVKQSIEHISDCINEAHLQTESVVILLENMAGQGNVIGSRFQELADIIERVKDKSRIGVCLDTCHTFAAGYDIRTPEKFDLVLKEFDSIIGRKYLKALHLNDSKTELGSHRDLHESIGKGCIGIDCFRFIMNDDRFHGIPMVLETPIKDNDYSVYKQEIELLYSLIEDNK